MDRLSKPGVEAVCPVPGNYRRFRLRGKDYWHVERGWSVRRVDAADRSRQVWRLFWGVVREGSEYPYFVNAYESENGFVEFEEFSDAVDWVEKRRGV